MLEQLKTIVGQATGVSPTSVDVSLRAPLGYQANRIYDARVNNRNLIVKEFLQPGEQQDGPAREFKALSLLAPLDIAPLPVYYQAALGPIVVYEFMEGEMWDRRQPTATDLAKLGATWLLMNSVTADCHWFSRGYEQSLSAIFALLRTRIQIYADWTAKEFVVGQPAAELCLNVLESRTGVVEDLANAVPVLCFCRADPRFANVIQRPDGRLGLIDWEDSGLRDPARDLADVMTHPNQEDLISPASNWRTYSRSASRSSG